MPAGHPDQGRDATALTVSGLRPAAGRARWRPTSARCGRRTCTSTRASATSTSSCARRPARPARSRAEATACKRRSIAEPSGARIRYRIRSEARAARPTRPRLAVFRSLKHIYVQAIDDAGGTHAGRTPRPSIRSVRGLAPATAATSRRPSVVGGAIAEQAEARGRRARWSSIAAASSTTDGSRPWRMRRAKADSSSRVSGRGTGWRNDVDQADRVRRAAGAGRPHQPRDQGRQGREELLVLGAGRRRRRQRLGRLRHGQGPRGARRRSRRASSRPSAT